MAENNNKQENIILCGANSYQQKYYFTETTKIPTHVAEYPLDCVAIGTGKALDNIKELIESSK